MADRADGGSVSEKPKLAGSQILASAAVAVIVPGLGAWLGAHTGTQGTMIGTAVGAALSVLTGWLVLRVTYHAKTGLARVPWRKAKPWHIAAGAPVVAGVVFVAAMATVTGVEAKVLHKSLSAAVTHTGGSGTTLGGVLANHPASPAPSLSAPSAVPSVSVTGTPVSAPSAVQASQTVMPAESPTASAPVPAGAPSGTVNPAPAATGETP